MKTIKKILKWYFNRSYKCTVWWPTGTIVKH